MSVSLTGTSSNVQINNGDLHVTNATKKVIAPRGEFTGIDSIALTTESNVGLANVAPIHTLDVGSKFSVDETGATTVRVRGLLHADTINFNTGAGEGAVFFADANGSLVAEDALAYNAGTNVLTVAGGVVSNGALDVNSTADVSDTLTLSKASGTGLSVTAGATVGGALGVSGVSTLAGVGATTLSTSGAATLASADVTADATVGGTLDVTGVTTLAGVGATTISTSGAATLASADVTEDATVGGTLAVTGVSTLASAVVTAGATVGGTLGVTGTTTLADVGATTLSTSGVATLASAAVTEDATVGGTLAVTGVSTLAGVGATTLSTSGAATLASAAVTAGATVGGTLGVTGVSTLAAVGATTLSTSGPATLASADLTADATVGGTLGVSGQLRAASALIDNNLQVNGNLIVDGELTVLTTQNLVIQDPLIELGNTNTDASVFVDVGMVFRQPQANSNVAVYYDASDSKYRVCLTENGAYDTSITPSADLIDMEVTGNMKATANVDAVNCNISGSLSLGGSSLRIEGNSIIFG